MRSPPLRRVEETARAQSGADGERKKGVKSLVEKQDINESIKCIAKYFLLM